MHLCSYDLRKKKARFKLSVECDALLDLAHVWKLTKQGICKTVLEPRNDHLDVCAVLYLGEALVRCRRVDLQ